MPIIYDDQEVRPVQDVSIQNSYQELGDGRRIGSTVTATLHGNIVAEKSGNIVTPLAIENKLATILSKQAQIRAIFANNGRWFEIQGWDGTAPTKFMATVDSIEFSEGPWTEVCAYTVVLHGEFDAGEEPSENNHIESANETWQFDAGDGPHTYNVTHTLNVKGKTVYDPNGTIPIPAWKYARIFATNKLTLDWNTQNTKWSNDSGNNIFYDGNIAPEANLLPFNRVVLENVDETEGSYTATETFFLSTQNYWEEYTISYRKETGNPLLSTTATVSGVIHGLTDKLHDPEGKLANALARWTTVQTLVYNRLTANLPTINFNVRHTTESFDADINQGTVSYTHEYDDRVLINNTYEWYNVIQETGMEDSKTTVRIDGVIIGVRYPNDVFDPILPFNRAYDQFQIVKNQMLIRCKAESSVPDLRAFPVSASVTPDKQAGQIGYSFVFDNRIPETVRDEFNVGRRFSREDGRTIVTVSGTITGLRSNNATWPFTSNSQYERYNTALSYFNGMKDNIIGLAQNYTDVTKVNSTPFNQSVNHIPNGGQVTYEYEFNSIPSPCVAGALSENITITDDAAIPVIAIIPVLGRKSGPVIQNIGTVKERRRSVTIEVVMATDKDTNMCTYTTGPSVDISLYAPSGSVVFLEQDQTQWSPSNGHYSRSVAWIYEL